MNEQIRATAKGAKEAAYASLREIVRGEVSREFEVLHTSIGTLRSKLESSAFGNELSTGQLSNAIQRLDDRIRGLEQALTSGMAVTATNKHEHAEPLTAALTQIEEMLVEAASTVVDIVRAESGSQKDTIKSSTESFLAQIPDMVATATQRALANVVAHARGTEAGVDTRSLARLIEKMDGLASSFSAVVDRQGSDLFLRVQSVLAENARAAHTQLAEVQSGIRRVEGRVEGARDALDKLHELVIAMRSASEARGTQEEGRNMALHDRLTQIAGLIEQISTEARGDTAMQAARITTALANELGTLTRTITTHISDESGAQHKALRSLFNGLVVAISELRTASQTDAHAMRHSLDGIATALMRIADEARTREDSLNQRLDIDSAERQRSAQALSHALDAQGEATRSEVSAGIANLGERLMQAQEALEASMRATGEAMRAHHLEDIHTIRESINASHEAVLELLGDVARAAHTIESQGISLHNQQCVLVSGLAGQMQNAANAVAEGIATAAQSLDLAISSLGTRHGEAREEILAKQAEYFNLIGQGLATLQSGITETMQSIASEQSRAATESAQQASSMLDAAKTQIETLIRSVNTDLRTEIASAADRTETAVREAVTRADTAAAERDRLTRAEIERIRTEEAERRAAMVAELRRAIEEASAALGTQGRAIAAQNERAISDLGRQNAHLAEDLRAAGGAERITALQRAIESAYASIRDHMTRTPSRTADTTTSVPTIPSTWWTPAAPYTAPRPPTHSVAPRRGGFGWFGLRAAARGIARLFRSRRDERVHT